MKLTLPPFLLHWMEKWRSIALLLEHLESSGVKIMTRGPIVRQFGAERNRETNKLLVINFTFFSHVTFSLRCWFPTLAKYSSSLGLLLELVSAKATIWTAKKQLM